MEVHPWNTVKEVKDAIQTSVSPDHLTLMFNGKTLHDKCKISDYGVQQYSELVLHIEEAIKEWPVRQKRKIESPHGPGEGMKIAEHETQIEHTQDRHSEGDFKAYEVTRDPDEKQDPLELMWKRLCRTQVCSCAFPQKTLALSFKLKSISSRLSLRKYNMLPWRLPPPNC